MTGHDPSPPLAAIEARLRLDPYRWAWWAVGVALVVITARAGAEGDWAAAGVALYAASMALTHPLNMRDARIAGYAEGWRHRSQRDPR